MDSCIDKFRYWRLFLLGLMSGLIIELGLGYISRSQFWLNTKYLPIPVWLPLAWGFGFVLIYKIGNLLEIND